MTSQSSLFSLPIAERSSCLAAPWPFLLTQAHLSGDTVSHPEFWFLIRRPGGCAKLIFSTTGAPSVWRHTQPPPFLTTRLLAKCQYLKLGENLPPVCGLPLFAALSPPPVFTFFLSVGLPAGVAVGCRMLSAWDVNAEGREGGAGEGGGRAAVALSCWLHPFLLCPTCHSRQTFLKYHGVPCLWNIYSKPTNGSTRKSCQN